MTPWKAAGRKALVFLLVVGTSSCEQTTAPRPDDGSPLVVPLNVHLLSSDSSEALDTTVDEAALDTLFSRINAIWAPAGITFDIANVRREAARHAADFERLLADGVILGAVIPSDSLHPDGWDMFVIRDLRGVAGGIYYLSIPAVLWPELTPAGTRDLSGDGGRIAAHELGHMLGLDHASCTPTGNLMAPECPSDAPERLERAQVDRARQQVLRGRAFGA